MRQQTAIVLALFVAAVSVIGAASYTQATVDRDANIQVQSDSAALVGLSVGGGITDTDDSVQMNDEKLFLNLDDDGTGVNGNATFHYGADTARDTSNSAFNVTNNDADGSRDFTLSYVETTATANTNPNVKFDVYSDSNGTFEKIGAVSEESDMPTRTLGSSETLYVFVTVDTTNLSSTDDLSGRFTVKAS